MSEQSKQTTLGRAFIEPSSHVYPPDIYPPDTICTFEHQLQLKPVIRKPISAIQQKQAKLSAIQTDDEREEEKEEKKAQIHPESCLKCFLSPQSPCPQYVTHITEFVLSSAIFGHHEYNYTALDAINTLLLNDEKWIILPIDRVKKFGLYMQCINRCGAFICGPKKEFVNNQCNNDEYYCSAQHQDDHKKDSIIKPDRVSHFHYFATPAGIYIYIIYTHIYFVQYVVLIFALLYRYN